MDPCKSLCTYDKRNPYGYLSCGPIDDDDVAQPRQQGCACDNCFYGRDKLAMEVIRLRAALKAICDLDEVSGYSDTYNIAHDALNPKP